MGRPFPFTGKGLLRFVGHSGDLSGEPLTRSISGIRIVPATLLTGAGLSASSGLNAYLPLLILALADRVSSAIQLAEPFDAVSSNWAIMLLLVLLPIEMVGDKIPRWDQVNDRIHTVIRPVVGAICFAAVASQNDQLNAWAAAALGVIIAGAAHVMKARARPAITRRTKGLGNPYVSIVEDAVAILVSIVALAWSWGTLLAVPLGWLLLRRTYSRLVTGESRLVRTFLPGRQGHRT